MLSGTKYGTVTNDKGFYEIKNIAPGEYTVVFSSIGYFPERLKVALSPGDTVTRCAELKESSSKTKRGGGYRCIARYRAAQQPGTNRGDDKK
jgi:hypothetical protein